jgi:hypothetical protein
MNFAIDCCCSRKTNKATREMSELRKEDNLKVNKNLSDIYELVMTPCETISDTSSNIIKIQQPRKNLDVYVNFFEDMDGPLTPKTPDVNENMINLSIPKGSYLYVNYQKYNFT